MNKYEENWVVACLIIIGALLAGAGAVGLLLSVVVYVVAYAPEYGIAVGIAVAVWFFGRKW